MKQDLLEFSILKSCLSCASQSGRQALDELEPCADWSEVEERWACVSEFMDLLSAGQHVHLAALPEVYELLGLKDGAVLDGQALLDVAASLSQMARVAAELEDCEHLGAVAGQIEPFGELYYEIIGRIEPGGEVSERGNPLLRELRQRYRNLRTQVLGRMEDLLKSLSESVVMDELITTRGDRYVLPIRTDACSRVAGIAHDYSRSRQTIYVEPLELVESNNELNRLRADIRDAEYKVLKELTAAVSRSAGRIINNLQVYGRLDLLHAIAQWGLKVGATIPQLSEGEIELRGARHPLLIERLGLERTVALDLLLSAEKSCLVISGANAGGKTVALKTLGLLLLLAKCGLPLPVASGSRLPRFGRILVEMDASQDIEHGLSSFTAHAANLKRIYAQARPGDLVLLDEPGSGTDYQAGGAFAVAYIDALLERGIYVVLTSHAEQVKLYGLASARAENAATAFDETGLKPLYALRYGLMGLSRPFDILRSIDFPPEVLASAQAIVAGQGETPLSRALQDISRATELRQQAEARLAEAERVEAQLKSRLNQFEQERLKAATRLERLLDKASYLARNPQPRETVKAFSESPEVKELRQSLKDAGVAETFKVVKGATVCVKGGSARGEVVELVGPNAVVVCGSKRLTLPVTMLTAEPTAKLKPARGGKPAGSPQVMPIMVIGLHVDEALSLVERAVDKALLAGQASLEIIHGHGTGALKQAIREQLAALPNVASVHDAAGDEGGSAKTIVEFKP
ncbi:MAG: Endonuclease MutS2 [Deltaproteobacteria bacterium ADurb.Bin510]|nr:MAG: Endonuclease MutS2 [Deltaproteobacteria bacterium ADurb.Bin510]